MHPFPHHYRVVASGPAAGDVWLSAEGLATIRSASPAEFDGPGDRWSPETLLVGALADCFILTFHAVAKASNVAWTSLDCEVTGTLDRVDRVTQFVRFHVSATLRIPAGSNSELAQRAMEKAERGCLISNSLKAEVVLAASVAVEADAAPSERQAMAATMRPRTSPKPIGA